MKIIIKVDNKGTWPLLADTPWRPIPPFLWWVNDEDPNDDWLWAGCPIVTFMSENFSYFTLERESFLRRDTLGWFVGSKLFVYNFEPTNHPNVSLLKKLSLSSVKYENFSDYSVFCIAFDHLCNFLLHLNPISLETEYFRLGTNLNRSLCLCVYCVGGFVCL